MRYERFVLGAYPNLTASSRSLVFHVVMLLCGYLGVSDEVRLKRSFLTSGIDRGPKKT